MSNVLGVGGFWHEASIAAHDNEAGFNYLALERFNRKKNSGFDSPEEAELLMQHLSIDPKGVDHAVWINQRAYEDDFFGIVDTKQWFDKTFPNRTILDHHQAHQALSYYSSPFNDALLISIDDTGDGISCRIGHGKGSKIKDIAFAPDNASFGRLWEAVSIIMGYPGPDSAGKVMSLSAFGSSPKYLPELNKLIVRDDKTIYRFADDIENNAELKKLLSHTYTGNMALASYLAGKCGLTILDKSFHSVFGSANSYKGINLKDYYDLVLSIQEFTSEFVTQIAADYSKQLGTEAVCLSGGVALNCPLNTRIAEEVTKQIYIPPACSDCGLTLGGVLWVRNMVLDEPTRLNPGTISLGPTFEDEYAKRLAKFSSDIKFQESDDIYNVVAELLSKGKVVGWYQSGSEMGPRALGHRSILSHPGKSGQKRRLNDEIKHREAFRPFAPAILKDKLNDYFKSPDTPYITDFMLAILEAKQPELIGEALHVDNLGRVQTVSKDMNPDFFKLLTSFEQKTGLPVLLNTSFNGHGEPIVHTPEDAVRCFLNNGIDALAMGKYLITRKGQ